MAGRTRIKICGISDVACADAAVGCGADSIGLVFVEGSPRFVDVGMARLICERLPSFVEAVGLFVDESGSDILGICEEVGLGSVQLHGGERPGIMGELGGLRVIKALGFAGVERLREDVLGWSGGLPGLKGILVDGPGGGGLGEGFDWSGLAGLVEEGLFEGCRPLILAGGLDAGNVGDAIAEVRPFGVDVSSGVESLRGVKDAQKIAAFCQAVRRADFLGA